MEQEKRKFVLKNVPECQPDYLQDYIEYHLDNDVIQMKRLGVFPDIVLITMKDDINFVEAEGKVKREPFEDQRLIMLPTWQVFSIVVCNIDYNVLSAEFLQLYIENTFADGEAVVAVCTTWPRNGVATIQFEKASPSDLVQRILAVDQHVPFPRDLGEYCITMEPFYHNFHDCLKQDVALTVQDGSCFKSDIGLSAQSGSKFADTKIAESKTNAFVESEMASSLVIEQNGDLGGNKQEEHQKKEHIDYNIPRGRGVTCRESRASHSVYKVENKLLGTHDNHTRQTTESRGGGRGREHDTRSYNFGDVEASVPTKCTFQGLSRVDATEAVSKISNNKVEEIDVSLIQAEVMIEQFGKSNDLYVQYERSTSKVIIHGLEEKVREKHMSILCELRKIKEDSLELSPIMSKILSQGKGDQFLNASLQDVHWLITGRTLQVASYEKVSIDKAIQFLKESLNYKQVLEMKIESTYNLWQLKDELESKLHLVVSWDDKKEHITIEGLKKDVVTAKCRIKDFLEEYEEVCEKFEVHGINARFFHSFLISEVEQSLKGVTLLKREWTDTLVTYVIRGKRDVLKQTMKTLKDLEIQIIPQKWSLKSEFKKAEEIGLIVYRVMHTPLKEEFRELEMQNKCLVIFSDGVHGMTPAQNKSVDPDSIPTKGRSSRPVAKSKVGAISQSPVETKDVVLSITPSCQMRIKTRGDIAQERSDILVCVLINEERIRMKKTRIGLAFSQANHSLEEHLQAERKAMQDMTVTITGPFQNLNCQAIAAIFLSKWDPTSSVSLLTKAIEHILSEAVARGAKSISFPALGSGRALKFPPAEVAKISMSTIKSFFSAPTAGNLQDIVFVLPDRDLFACFKTVSTNHFTAVSSPRINVAGSEDPNEEFDKDDDDDDDDDDDADSADESVNFILGNGNENMNVTILALKDADMLGMWNKVTAKLKLLCLAKDFFNQEEIDHWPKQARYEIVEEAKKRHVWVEMSKNPKTGKPGYVITGEKCAARDMRNVIGNIFIKLLQRMPKSLKSSNAPKRHTTHFLNYAAGLDNDKHFPSYWKLNKSKTFFQKICASLSQGEGKVLVDVEKKTSMAVENLVMNTWKANLVGQGRDASGLSHKGIKVISVKRVENPQLFEKFNFKRKLLFRKASDCGRVCTPVKDISRVTEGVNTTQNLEYFMKEELYGEINEHYLFHGCPSSFLQAILTQGLDPKVSSVKALFGKAIYFAESSTKSDQYADEKGNRTANGTQLVMILARVLLGNVFICDQNHPTVAKKDAEKLKRPPCMNCKQDVCNCHGTHFDSVLGEGKWLFREFMVYGENECYPEYVINYVRV